jgi:nitrilase
MHETGKNQKLVRIAAVQAAPVFLDRDASVEKACKLIRECGEKRIDLVGFPEGFIPTHPLWYHFHPASSPEAFKFAKRLFANSVEIPSEATETLCAAARTAGTFVVMGLCERESKRIGTMYNTLLFIDGEGQIVGRHRKLVPTLGERIVHAPGDALGLRAYPTRFGRVGGLMCGENSNPLADFVLNANGVNLHVAAWPSHFNLGVDMNETIMITTRGLAYRLKAYVINAVGEVSEAMRQELPVTDEHRAYLEKQGGGASILGPRGQIIAGPMQPGEGILYADVSLDDIVAAKLVHDFGGHYNRFDIFEVHVKTGVWPNLVSNVSGGAEAECEPHAVESAKIEKY